MSRRILLADDSVTIQKVIELTFMDDDYEVRAVGNGDEALAMLGALKVDFVIADVHMPGASGYEVCRRSKQQQPHVPVLLLVGTFEPFDEAQARECGANAFLKKPFDSQELLGRVHDLLGPDPAETAEAEPHPPAAGAAATSDAQPPYAATSAPHAGMAGIAPPATLAPPPPASSAGLSAAAFDAAAEPDRLHLLDLPPLSGVLHAAPPASPFLPDPAPPSAAAASAPPPLEAAASWQEFELEAEPEAPADPWLSRPAAAPPPVAAPPPAADFALDAAPAHRSSGVAGFGDDPLGGAVGTRGPGEAVEQPFALGDLESDSFEHGGSPFLPSASPVAPARPESLAGPERATMAEPVVAAGTGRSTFGADAAPAKASPPPAIDHEDVAVPFDFAAAAEPGPALAATPAHAFSAGATAAAAGALAGAAATAAAVTASPFAARPPADIDAQPPTPATPAMPATSATDAAGAAPSPWAAAPAASAAAAAGGEGVGGDVAGGTHLDSPPPPSAAAAPPATAAAPPAAPVTSAPAAQATAAPSATPATPATPAITDADVERIARRVVELLGDKVVRDVAWEVIPDLAEVVIKDRLRELESQVE